MLGEPNNSHTLENGNSGRAVASNFYNNRVSAARQSCVSFDRFRVFPSARRLTKDGKPINIGGRAFDILVALVEQPGVVLSKAALMTRVWPGLSVEESSLRVHIAALRKTLDDSIGKTRYIANVAGRGYCFVAPVSIDDSHAFRLPQTLMEIAQTIANERGVSTDQFLLTLIAELLGELRALRRHDLADPSVASASSLLALAQDRARLESRETRQ